MKPYNIYKFNASYLTTKPFWANDTMSLVKGEKFFIHMLAGEDLNDGNVLIHASFTTKPAKNWKHEFLDKGTILDANSEMVQAFLWKSVS